MDNDEEQTITINMVKHTVSVFWSKKHRRLIAGVIVAALGLVVLHCMPAKWLWNGRPTGEFFALILLCVMAFFLAVTGISVFFSNIKKFDLLRYIITAAASAVVLLMLISVREVFGGIDITVKVNFFSLLWVEILGYLPIFAAALTGSILVGYVFGGKRT